jgi:hypothetical protein
MFLAKETLVSEIAELSRTFNVKLFSGIIVTGASYRIYGTFENMLNAASLKPLLKFDMPSASLLYVLLRMPLSLKDKLPRAKIELAIANWFKEKTSLQSIYITEPIYTEDLTDRIDAVLFVGGFDVSTLFADIQRKVERLKKKAVAKGFMTDDWQVISPKIEEEEPKEVEPAKAAETLLPTPEEPILEAQPTTQEDTISNLENLEENPKPEEPTITQESTQVAENTQAPVEESAKKETEAKEKAPRRLGIIGKLSFRRKKQNKS